MNKEHNSIVSIFVEFSEPCKGAMSCLLQRTHSTFAYYVHILRILRKADVAGIHWSILAQPAPNLRMLQKILIFQGFVVPSVQPRAHPAQDIENYGLQSLCCTSCTFSCAFCASHSFLSLKSLCFLLSKQLILQQFSFIQT